MPDKTAYGTVYQPRDEGARPKDLRTARVVSGILILLLTLTTTPTLSVVGEEIAPSQVRSAIEKGVDYLKTRQNPNGTWGEWPDQPGGVTSLATLALLNAGVPVTDPAIEKALASLRKVPPTATYAVSLQTMVFCRATSKQDRLLIARNARWLEGRQTTSGSRRGAWSYPGLSTTAVVGGDNSNAQFALLALYEAEQVGIEVSGQVWRLAKNYWEDCQNVDGSWGYLKGLPGTGSMTAAGISSIVIVEDRVGRADAHVDGDNIQCCGGRASNPHLDRALDWLGRNFSVSRNPGLGNQLGVRGKTWLHYYLYGMERVGRMTNRRFIGAHDWYREGTDALLRTQDSLSGYWKGIGSAEEDEVICTSFAVLFLSKGRWPVLVAKLKHTTPDDWNQHRNDLGSLTRYVEKRWQRDLTWQTLDLKAASVDDLMQAPVLYLCGSKSPLPESAADQDTLAQKLRDYLERGGFLFAEAYCGSTGFHEGFRTLVQKVFPEPEYRLRLLPPEHPIWFAEENVPAGQVRPLLGIDFGCRTSVIYAPLDPVDAPRPSLSCLWELARGGRPSKHSAAVQSQIDAALSIGVNVLAYATNREVQEKDLRVKTVVRKTSDKLDRGRVRVAVLRHPGGCNVAPRAVANLLDAAHEQMKLRTRAEMGVLGIEDDSLFDYPLVFMHGRNNFHLTDGERKQLRAYVERGGTILADAVCASQAFADSFRREMATIFPDKPLTPIPSHDPILTSNYNGSDLSRVKRREPSIRSATDPLKAVVREGPPVLEAIKIEGRYQVIFSPYDISCALEKQDSLECAGYLREDAARIALNILLYALHE